jgi:hypothetical protein
MHNTIEYIREHLITLLFTSVIAMLFILSLMSFAHDRAARTFIVILMGILYCAWGITYHTVRKDMRVSVFIEYLLISLIGTLGLLGIINWS